MNNSSVIKSSHSQHRRGFSALGLVLAGVIGVCGAAGSASVHAQATAGHIFGKAPAGDSIVAKSTSNGTQRTVIADDKGRYSLRALPVGKYMVTLEKDGTAIEKFANVQVIVGRGMNVNFSCAPDNCAAGASQQ